MSESNNNVPIPITQLQEATAYEDGMYYAVAKAGHGTWKIKASLINNRIKTLEENYNIMAGLNKLCPDEIILNKSFVNGVWADSPNYYTTGLLEIPSGYTLINYTYPSNDDSPRMNNDNCRAITILDASGSLVTSLEYKYFYQNTTENTLYARITEWSSVSSGYKGKAMAVVVNFLYNTTSPSNVYDARSYEDYKIITEQNNNIDNIKKTISPAKNDFVFAVVDGNGDLSPNSTRLSTMSYYPIKKGDIIIINQDNVAVAYCIYDKNKNRIDSTGYYSMKPQNPNDTTVFRPFTVNQDGYIRIHLRMLSGVLAPINVNECITIIHQTDTNNIIALKEYNNNRVLQSRKPQRLPSVNLCGQDGTFINEKLWSFEDGKINIIDMETYTYTTKIQNLGHGNCVDYNENNDCLITYGASGNNQPILIIYNNPESATELLLTDENCTIINLFNSNEFLSMSGSLCWGESDCIAYFISGVYADSSQTIAETREIYKLLLGMGDNDLSAAGFGVFVSGKNNNEYNGTCKILKIYNGNIEYIDTIYGRSNLETPQGMTYDKYIYLGYGTRGHNFLKIALNDDSNSYNVIDNYYCNIYNYDGSISYFEPEMIAIKDSFIYTGSILSGNKLFYKIPK